MAWKPSSDRFRQSVHKQSIYARRHINQQHKPQHLRHFRQQDLDRSNSFYRKNHRHKGSGNAGKSCRQQEHSDGEQKHCNGEQKHCQCQQDSIHHHNTSCRNRIKPPQTVTNGNSTFSFCQQKHIGDFSIIRHRQFIKLSQQQSVDITLIKLPQQQLIKLQKQQQLIKLPQQQPITFTLVKQL